MAEQIIEDIKKLSILTSEEIEQGDIEFVRFVKERDARIQEVKRKVIQKFGLSEEEYKKMPRETKMKLVNQLGD